MSRMHCIDAFPHSLSAFFNALVLIVTRLVYSTYDKSRVNLTESSQNIKDSSKLLYLALC